MSVLELYNSSSNNSRTSTAYSTRLLVAGHKRTLDQYIQQQASDHHYNTTNNYLNEFLVPAKTQKLSYTAELTETHSPLSDISSTSGGMASPPSAVTHFTAPTKRELQLTADEKTLQKEQTHCGYTLFITDEPEENYRARYESEGCRGPMKGRSGGCPSVMFTCHQMSQPPISGTVSVELTNSDGTQLQSCRLDSTDDGQNLCKKLQLTDKTPFDNLRIRRLKKTDAHSKGTASGVKPLTSKGRGKQDEKQAHLLFTAVINIDGNQTVTLKALSHPIFLNANHDPPDIHRIVPQYGTTGDPIALIGTRMHSPRVTFIFTDSQTGREQEVPADYEKEISHQNALVVKVPQLPSTAFSGNNSLAITTHIRVTAGKGDRTGREPLKSNLSPFTYIKQGGCKECSLKQVLPPVSATPTHYQPYHHYYALRPTPPAVTHPPLMMSSQAPPTSSLIMTSQAPPTSSLMMTSQAPPLMMTSQSVIVSAPPTSVSPVRQTPPTSVPATPTQGDVAQILEELCEQQYTPPPNYVRTQSPVRYTPTHMLPSANMSGITLDQPQPEELDCYFPTHNSPLSSSSPSCHYSTNNRLPSTRDPYNN